MKRLKIAIVQSVNRNKRVQCFKRKLAFKNSIKAICNFIAADRASYEEIKEYSLPGDSHA